MPCCPGPAAAHRHASESYVRPQHATCKGTHWPEHAGRSELGSRPRAPAARCKLQALISLRLQASGGDQLRATRLGNLSNHLAAMPRTTNTS